MDPQHPHIGTDADVRLPDSHVSLSMYLDGRFIVRVDLTPNRSRKASLARKACANILVALLASPT